MTKRLPGPWTDDWEQAMRRIAALEAAVLRLLEAGDGMRSALDETNPATWRHEIKAWDVAASAAKGLVGK